MKRSQRPAVQGSRIRRTRAGSMGCGGPARSGGFTLLESMVSFVVLGIGLLGMAALQGSAIRYSNEAYLNSQATIAAYDILERMRANPAGISGGYYISEKSDVVDAANEFGNAPRSNDIVDCAITSCTPEQLALYDLEKWMHNLGDLLPSGTGSVRSSSANQYTAVISWARRTDSRDSSATEFQTISVSASM